MAAKVHISVKHCKGCKLCLEACPRGALKLTGKHTDAGIEIIEWDESMGCTGCLLCASMCPDAAITITDASAPKDGAKKPK